MLTPLLLDSGVHEWYVCGYRLFRSFGMVSPLKYVSWMKHTLAFNLCFSCSTIDLFSGMLSPLTFQDRNFRGDPRDCAIFSRFSPPLKVRRYYPYSLASVPVISSYLIINAPRGMIGKRSRLGGWKRGETEGARNRKKEKEGKRGTNYRRKNCRLPLSTCRRRGDSGSLFGVSG